MEERTSATGNAKGNMRRPDFGVQERENCEEENSDRERGFIAYASRSSRYHMLRRIAPAGCRHLQQLPQQEPGRISKGNGGDLSTSQQRLQPNPSTRGLGFGARYRAFLLQPLGTDCFLLLYLDRQGLPPSPATAATSSPVEFREETNYRRPCSTGCKQGVSFRVWSSTTNLSRTRWVPWNMAHVLTILPY